MGSIQKVQQAGGEGGVEDILFLKKGTGIFKGLSTNKFHPN